MGSRDRELSDLGDLRQWVMAKSCNVCPALLMILAGLFLLLSCGSKKHEEREGREVHQDSSEPHIPQLNAPDSEALAQMSGAEIFAKVCAACHGAKGEGNESLRSPSIAGLPEWYTTIQIEKFQKDYRGTDEADPAGLQMHQIASILDEAATQKVAAEIAKLKLIATTQTIEGGDPTDGAKIYRERCMECHRFNGRGEIVFRSAPLIGFQDWYIIDQLQKYKAGVRGGSEEDIDGSKMHEVAGRMTDEQMKDLAAYMVELADKYVDWVPRRERRLMEETEKAVEESGEPAE